MNYILASEFNLMLYHRALQLGYDVLYINTGTIYPITESDILIVDESNPLNSALTCDGKIYMLTTDEKKAKQQNHIYKFQSAPKILSSVFSRNNKLTLFIGNTDAFEVEKPSVTLIKIDLNYTPHTNTSLTELIDLLKHDTMMDIIYKPIGTFMDVLKPPLRSIEELIHVSLLNSDTIIYSASLKGPCDALLLSHATELILGPDSDNEANLLLSEVLSQIYPNLVITKLPHKDINQERRGETWNLSLMRNWKHLKQKFWNQQNIMKKP